MYTVELIESITAIPRAEWDAMAPENEPLWRWSVYAAMEKSRIGLDGFAYLALRQNERRVAIIPTFWVDAMRLDDAAGKPSPLLQKVRRVWPRFGCVSTLFCGNPIAEGHLLVAPGVEDVDLTPLVDAAQALARQKRLGWIFFKDFARHDIERLFAGSIRSPFFEVEAMPDAVLSLPFRDFEGYLAHLSKKSRWSARSRLRKVHGAPGVRVEVIEDFAPLIPQMLPLYRQVYDHADVRLELWNEEFLAALAANRELRPALIACWKDDRLIGFLLCVSFGGECVSLRVGLDYAQIGELPVYFVLFAESIRLALRRGCKTVNFTQTSYTTKLRMGSHVRPCVHAVTHTNPVLRLLAGRYLPGVMGEYRGRDEVYAWLAEHPSLQSQHLTDVPREQRPSNVRTDEIERECA